MNGSQIWTVGRRWWRSTDVKGRLEEQGSPSGCLPTTSGSFQLLYYSSLPYSSPGGSHCVAIITKVTMP